MLMCTSCQMNFDRAFFGKEIWACIEIDGLLVNFHQKKRFFLQPIRRLSKRESNLLLPYTHILARMP